MHAIDSYYAREADRIARGPQNYGGDPKIVALAAFRRYHKDATYDLPDAEGVLRWVTRKQMRVHGIIARISLSPDGRAKMIDIALEAQCSTATVSRTILKLQAWGLFAVDVRRGRNGGITVLRPRVEWMAYYVKAARQKLRDMAFRARIKLASMIHGEDEAVNSYPDTPNSYVVGMDESFSRKAGLTAENVVYERAMLALTDPEGEMESINPLRRHEAIALLDWRAPADHG
jgi:hypothetical protein